MSLYAGSLMGGAEGGPVEMPRDRPSSPAGTVLALIIAAAAFAVVLVGVRSTLFDLDRHSVPKELVVHTTALLALPFLLGGLRRIEAGIVSSLLAAFIGWSALSGLFATNHWIAFRAFGLSLSGFILFLAGRRIRNVGRTRMVISALAVAAAMGALIGAAQAYGLDLPWLADERAPGGTFGNRNFLAHLIAIALPALVLVALRARRLGARLAFVTIAICASAVVLTRSRAAWLAVAVSGMVGIIAVLAMRGSDRPDRRRLLAITVAFAAGCFAAVVLPNTLDWRSDSPYTETLRRITEYRSGSGHGRLIQYRNSLKLVARNPVFGAGPGNWFVDYPLVTSAADPSYSAADPIPTNPWPSSDYVALIVERGPIGLALAICVGVSLLITTWLRIRRDSRATPDAAAERNQPLEGATLLAVLGAAFTAGAFDAVLLNPAPLFFVAALAGVLAPDTRPVARYAPPRRLRLTFAAAAIILEAGLVAHSSLELRSIRLTTRSESRTVVERALRLDPGNYRLQLLLARNGPCSRRLPHARVAARLLPHHEAPQRALRACGG